jgi:O-antigen ligase
MNAGEIETNAYDSPFQAIKESLLYLYTAVCPFFVFSIAFGRDTIALWVLAAMFLIFIVEFISSMGRFWTHPSFIPLALFFLSFIIGTLLIYFQDPGNTLMGRTPFDRAIITDLRLLFMLVSFLVCVNFLANAPRRVFLTILKIQLVVGTCLALIGLLQWAAFILYGQSEFLKFEPTNDSFLGKLNFFRLGRYKMFRSASIFNEPSYFGFFLVPLLMKAIMTWGQDIKIFSRFWLGSMLFLIILSLFSNLSFTAVFSVVILFIIVAVILWFGPHRKMVFVILILFIGFATILTFLPYSNVIFERVSRVFDLRDASTLDRLFRVYTSSIVFIEHPLMGVGPGGYAFYYTRMGGLDKKVMATPLNMWLNFLNDVGLIGTILFIIFIVMIFRLAVKSAKHDPLAGVYLWSMIAYLVLLTTLDFWFVEMIWFEIALLLCVSQQGQPKNLKGAI